MARFSLISTLVALFVLCLSVVRAAELYAPGNPFNCTAFKDNCRSLVISRFGGGKNATFSSVSSQCNGTITDVKPLCDVKVACFAVFAAPNQPVAPPPMPGNGTNATAGAPVPATFTKESLTDDLIAMYDTSKCPGTSGVGSLFQASTSFGALVALVAMISVIIQTI
ncbi:hypothetical protein DFQ26_004333 [Actinomortierella ambigua]|nr:hypothetical protein DFQ26_004330 [Actinomortierella ambigua]KAF9161673.1 hypothetical protein DFQ26_004333 [Actinomortierella ambigua]